MGWTSRSVLKARKAPLDLSEDLVGGDDLVAAQMAGGDAGAQHVDAVELGLGGDGVLVPGVGELILADVDGDVFGDLAPVQDPVHPHGDLVPAAQRGTCPRAGGGDLA